MTAITSTKPSIDPEDVKRVSAALFDRRRAGHALSGAEFADAVARRREALDEPALLSNFVVLDRPFLILETPRSELSIFIDAHYEALNSSAKILIDKHSGGDSTQFTFHFIWTNTAPTAAVINVSSSLSLNGFCEAIADRGIFSGHESWITMGALLSLIRWSGWGVDPATGQSRDQTPFPVNQPTQFKQVASVDVHGGGLFGDVGIEERAFQFEPFPLSCDLIAVPAGATMIFEVALLVQYGFSDGGDTDLVKLDLATDQFDRRVICPLVALELLTANAQP